MDDFLSHRSALAAFHHYVIDLLFAGSTLIGENNAV